MHEPKASALRNRDRYCIIRVCALTHALAAKCVLNVLFLVADFQPSRCVETYSRAVFHASDRNGIDLVSHIVLPYNSFKPNWTKTVQYLFNAHLSVLYAI